MKTLKQFVTEASLGRLVKTLLQRDQSPGEMRDRSEIHKKVLSTFSEDKNGESNLASAVSEEPHSIWTLAQHMENHPEFQARVLKHLEQGNNPGNKERANFLRDRMDVNEYLRKKYPDKFNDIRDGTKRYDRKTDSFVPATKDDVIPGHKDWKPPTSPEESYKRANNPDHPEYNPYLAEAIRKVREMRPEGYRLTQPSFAVSKDWIGK